MRYFIVHNNYRDEYDGKQYKQVFYEVTEPKKDSNGRWKVNKKIKDEKNSKGYIVLRYLDGVRVTEKFELNMYHETTGSALSSRTFKVYKTMLVECTFDYAEVTIANGGLSVTAHYIVPTVMSTEFAESPGGLYHLYTGEWYSVDFKDGYTVRKSLNTPPGSGGILIAKKNDWEIGSLYSGSNSGNNYCFYCKYESDNFMKISSANQGKVHKPEHGGKMIPTTTPTSDYNSEFIPPKNYNSNFTDGNFAKQDVSGERGKYVDGVARVPYIMLELSADGVPGSFNLSIPANSLVSLSHERNMADTYNKFRIEFFDKDAAQVEAKLLLGFRKVTFYYTDFVSTSKRFVGEILDYDSVIAGTGLMLAVSGYTSSTNKIITNRSIPWSHFVEWNSLRFNYVSNEKGEYIKYYPSLVEFQEGLANHQRAFRENYGDPQTGLKPPYKGDLYNYQRNMPKGAYYDLEAMYPGIMTYFSDDEGNTINIGEGRISDIVKIICYINNWEIGYIERTKKTSSTRTIKSSKIEDTILNTASAIPDQVNVTDTEYIYKSLLPLAESDVEGNSGNREYYFWFDENSRVHFATGYNKGDAKDGNIKKLYFYTGTGDNQKSTYPLVSFSAASSGSHLIMTGADMYMDAINIYTGDEIDVSTSQESNPYYQVEPEWFDYSKNKNYTFSTSQLGSQPVVNEGIVKANLLNRYNQVKNFCYQAELSVASCTDVSPGDLVEVIVFLNPSLKEYIPSGMHHSSGKYRILKITDSVSSGKFISTLTCLKYWEGSNTTKNIRSSSDPLVCKPVDEHPAAATFGSLSGGNLSNPLKGSESKLSN